NGFSKGVLFFGAKDTPPPPSDDKDIIQKGKDLVKGWMDSPAASNIKDVATQWWEKLVVIKNQWVEEISTDTSGKVPSPPSQNSFPTKSTPNQNSAAPSPPKAPTPEPLSPLEQLKQERQNKLDQLLLKEFLNPILESFKNGKVIEVSAPQKIVLQGGSFNEPLTAAVEEAKASEPNTFYQCEFQMAVRDHQKTYRLTWNDAAPVFKLEYSGTYRQEDDSLNELAFLDLSTTVPNAVSNSASTSSRPPRFAFKRLQPDHSIQSNTDGVCQVAEQFFTGIMSQSFLNREPQKPKDIAKDTESPPPQ
ncbi:MAG: hypothetical protein K2X66_02850, partial [Cyanobacteria bacterium]|nr:hypothetical protein [Cyanobacteriota bacterium]